MALAQTAKTSPAQPKPRPKSAGLALTPEQVEMHNELAKMYRASYKIKD
jgi:hypothetical protein